MHSKWSTFGWWWCPLSRLPGFWRIDPRGCSRFGRVRSRRILSKAASSSQRLAVPALPSCLVYFRSSVVRYSMKWNLTLISKGKIDCGKETSFSQSFCKAPFEMTSCWHTAFGDLGRWICFYSPGSASLDRACFGTMRVGQTACTSQAGRQVLL